MKERRQTVCPVCETSINSIFCPKCGFDTTRDYERYPTFAPVSGVPSAAALRARRQQSSEEHVSQGSASAQDSPSPRRHEPLLSWAPVLQSAPTVPAAKPEYKSKAARAAEERAPKKIPVRETPDKPEPIAAPVQKKKSGGNLVWLAAAAVVFALVVGIWIGSGIGGTNDNITVQDPQNEVLAPVPSDTALRQPDEAGEPLSDDGNDDAQPVVPQNLTLTVWTPTEDQIDSASWLLQMEEAFDEAHPEYSITWDNAVCYEGDAGNIISEDPAGAADVYMYIGDVMDDLVDAGAVERLDGSYLEQVLNSNNETMINAVTYKDGGIYGFPVAVSTWFMFYNKAIVGDADITSMEAILEKGVVTFDVANSWNLPAFFFAAGGSLFGEQGVDAAAGAQFGGQAGYDAAEALLKLREHPNFQWDGSGYGIEGLMNGSIAACFSGEWDYERLYAALGGNLGACAAPTVTIGGQTKQLLPYFDSEIVGVNPHSKNEKAAMEFAAFLASAESQKLRYELRGIIPVATELQSAEALRNDICAQAIYDTLNGKCVCQPKIPEMNYVWGPVGVFGSEMRDGKITFENYKTAVDTMQNSFPSS